MMCPVPVTDLLPHAETARLLTGVVRSDSGFIEAIGSVPAAHPLVSAERAPCFLALELGAQAAAAMEALVRPGKREPSIGYLTRIREADFLVPDLPVDTPLSVTARLEGETGPLAIYRIGVTLGEVDVVRAMISTHRGVS